MLDYVKIIENKLNILNIKQKQLPLGSPTISTFHTTDFYKINVEKLVTSLECIRKNKLIYHILNTRTRDQNTTHTYIST